MRGLMGQVSQGIGGLAATCLALTYSASALTQDHPSPATAGVSSSGGVLQAADRAAGGQSTVQHAGSHTRLIRRDAGLHAVRESAALDDIAEALDSGAELLLKTTTTATTETPSLAAAGAMPSAHLPVWCGGHRAEDCASCIQGRGLAVPAREWCNGHCFWRYGSSAEEACLPIAEFLAEHGDVGDVGSNLVASHGAKRWSAKLPLQAAAARHLEQLSGGDASSVEQSVWNLEGVRLAHARGSALQLSLGQHRATRVAKTNKSNPVWCGAHAAFECNTCPSGNGEVWCNGDCEWRYGNCARRPDLVWCGAHTASSCYFCTKFGPFQQEDRGYAYCGGDCQWRYPGFCAKVDKQAPSGWAREQTVKAEAAQDTGERSPNVTEAAAKSPE
eukprot:TRINITY_DN38401_c0_g2_i1.p1 TRINITY_DN38401_c0_g2~~TRINITY_DN38401_c0_g2_i1.p1  ORF type:complete len:388 (-),score=52.10 TRINITY_DN38401_c0_g2_i1:38-1201(-)